jgi:hypothetical protein
MCGVIRRHTGLAASEHETGKHAASVLVCDRDGSCDVPVHAHL